MKNYQINWTSVSWNTSLGQELRLIQLPHFEGKIPFEWQTSWRNGSITHVKFTWKGKRNEPQYVWSETNLFGRFLSRLHIDLTISMIDGERMESSPKRLAFGEFMWWIQYISHHKSCFKLIVCDSMNCPWPLVSQSLQDCRSFTKKQRGHRVSAALG